MQEHKPISQIFMSDLLDSLENCFDNPLPTSLNLDPNHHQNNSHQILELSEAKAQLYNLTNHYNSKSSHAKPTQSGLHNCPKHLIKLIIKCIGLQQLTALEVAKGFRCDEQETLQDIQNLLGVLEMVRKGRLPCFSKELLRIIFQNGAENVSRLKLLENPLVARVFRDKNHNNMAQAKGALRCFTVARLMENKDIYLDRSKTEKKSINQRYLEIFLEELRAGRIKERISKEEKGRILAE